MRRIVHHSVAFAAALCISALPAWGRVSATEAVLLHYQFAAGQNWSDHLSIEVRLAVSGSGLTTGANGVVTIAGRLHEQVLSVAADGSAQVKMWLDGQTMATTTGGKTLKQGVGAQPPQIVRITADGNEQGAVRGATGNYIAQATGNLPLMAVAPGARWTSLSHTVLPSALGAGLPPLRLKATNMFTRVLSVAGQQAAAVDSSGSLQYMTSSTVQGAPMRIHMTGTVTRHLIFGLSTHRPVSSTARTDLRAFVTTGVGSSAQAVNEHIVMVVAVTPL